MDVATRHRARDCRLAARRPAWEFAARYHGRRTVPDLLPKLAEATTYLTTVRRHLEGADRVEPIEEWSAEEREKRALLDQGVAIAVNLRRHGRSSS